MAPMELLAYSDKRLCVVAAIREYICRTRDLQGMEAQLFISYQKPYGPISKGTVAQWIWDVLHRAGVDTSRFGAHSTHSASTSGSRVVQWLKYYKEALLVNMGQCLLDSYFKTT